MKRWLIAAGVFAAVPLAACSSSPQAPSPLVPRAATSGASPTASPTVSPTVPHTASLGTGGRPRATLEVLTGTTTLTIGTADFGAGGTLLRVSTPAGGPPPHLRATDVSGTGRPDQAAVVELSAPGASQVTVTLNTAVGWRLILGG